MREMYLREVVRGDVVVVVVVIRTGRTGLLCMDMKSIRTDTWEREREARL